MQYGTKELQAKHIHVDYNLPMFLNPHTTHCLQIPSDLPHHLAPHLKVNHFTTLSGYSFA